MIDNKFMRVDVAIEIVAGMLGDITNAIIRKEDVENNKKLRKKYLNERDEIYKGNEEMVEYVIKTYGPILRERHRKLQKELNVEKSQPLYRFGKD